MVAKLCFIATQVTYYANTRFDPLICAMQMSLLSTPFIDNNDLFETGSTGGMSRDLIDRIPKMRFSAASNCDQETDSSCCSVCLQDFGVQQFVRALPQCQHVFHVRCIDNWLLRHASCPLCRASVHIDHIHM